MKFKNEDASEASIRVQQNSVKCCKMPQNVGKCRKMSENAAKCKTIQFDGILRKFCQNEVGSALLS